MDAFEYLIDFVDIQLGHLMAVYVLSGYEAEVSVL